MYIYGEFRESGETISAFPCFICKKMIINAGLRRIITSVKSEDKTYEAFTVDEWINEWREQDIIEDKVKYGK